MKIAFLFNHYTAHQVLHAAPIAFALSRDYPEIDVRIIGASAFILDTVRWLSRYYPGQRCTLIEARLPALINIIDPLLKNLLFSRKLAILRTNRDLFRGLDILVVPEKTSLQLKMDPEFRDLRFVYTHHGAGDREAGFYSELSDFDLVLAPGKKIYHRLVDSGLVQPEHCAMVGYPKFELAGAFQQALPAFPDPGRPTVLYNPHYARGESSWQKWGREVLESFLGQDEYNLIFSPHVLLYQRKWRHGARSLKRYRDVPHMHLDTGSLASLDMTYTRAADIYLGDVSSQIYEFLQKPRPCLFLDAHGVGHWQQRASYKYWQAGEVIRNIDELGPGLERARREHPQYEGVQRKLFEETFDQSDQPASRRAAEAIVRRFAG